MKKLFAALGIFLILSGMAYAHKVNIFAWLEGDTVFTESKFSGGKMVKNGKVFVYDEDKNLLLEGVTNDAGEFSFKIPKKTALVIELDATMGHANAWTISLDEILDAMGDEPVAAATEEPAQEDAAQPAMQTTSVSPAQTAPGANAEEIQAIVEKALDKKLKPITRLLVEAQERETEPQASDVFGGIGYILGLAGVAAYFHYRRKIKELEKA
ncbi:nickel transport protein [Desulfatibacillum alkenivorans DSM 16219]|jgi:nickel transport protein|uniref:Nickel transport protein n=1 Tax=Desulfatibacillum alkenivorans DSM 16219 TaxID=1121393 RepID=A0A1M6IDS5_9BACT|nr:hypothetical protein [Desulfatibacillum alkenivorans]SHJ32587.1 nickel transport protein [Desulfatibacillum alkenivorans DSM 16219]